MKSSDIDAGTVIGGLLVKALKNVSTILFYASCLCLFVLSFVVCYEIFARSIFNAPTIWVFEIAGYLMAITIFFGVAYVAQIDRYVKIDFVYNSLSTKGRRVIDVVAPLLSFTDFSTSLE